MLLALFAEHRDLLLVQAIGADLGQLTTASTDVVVGAQHILVLDSQREVVLCRQQQRLMSYGCSHHKLQAGNLCHRVTYH